MGIFHCLVRLSGVFGSLSWRRLVGFRYFFGLQLGLWVRSNVEIFGLNVGLVVWY